MATTPALELSSLTRRFGHGSSVVNAVDGIDLTINTGEIVALLGPNGAGKTTTIDMMLGLSQPSSGTVTVLGARPEVAVAAGRLAALLQTGGLLEDLTVRETVEVIAALHGKYDRVASVLSRADLDHLARRRVGACSGGEQQRLKFALAIIPDPDMLILDEPTAAMDVTSRRAFWDSMRAEADAGRTIVFATHYLEEAEMFARRTVVMNEGVIVADAPTAELRASFSGRTLAATVSDPKVLRALRNEPLLAGAEIDGDRLRIRVANSDAALRLLLDHGARDLEVTAPSLEDAFTALTKD